MLSCLIPKRYRDVLLLFYYSHCLSVCLCRASMKDVCFQESSPLGFLTWGTTSELWRAGWPCRMITAQCCTASLICTPSPSLRTQNHYRTISWTWQPACWPVALTPHAPSFSSSLWSVAHISLYNTAGFPDAIIRVKHTFSNMI